MRRRAFDDEERLLMLEGDVDELTIRDFRAPLRQLATTGSGTVDVSQVTFLPSMAVAAFVDHRRLAAEHGAELAVRAGHAVALAVLTLFRTGGGR